MRRNAAVLGGWNESVSLSHGGGTPPVQPAETPALRRMCGTLPHQ